MILSRPSFDAADELRRFRHFLRHAYFAPLDGARVVAVTKAWQGGRDALAVDLERFEAFLEAMALDLERRGPNS